jgi:hypothetical protein
MKREFLKGLGIEDESIINSIMDENGKDVTKEKTKAENYKEELEGVKEQLTTANTTIQSYKDMDIESIKQSAEDWKKKYEDDTKSLKDQMAKRDLEINTKEYLSKFKFANERVAKSIMNDFMAKEFKYEDGKFLGAEDYMNSLKESEPDSFLSEEKPPEIVKPTGGAKPTKKMSITDAMKYANEHPGIDIRTLI